MEWILAIPHLRFGVIKTPILGSFRHYLIHGRDTNFVFPAKRKFIATDGL